MRIIDIHTHNTNAEHALISVTPDRLSLYPDSCCSVGLHPWHLESVSETELEALKTAASFNNVYAIGECGIDKLRGASLDIQRRIFEYHIQLSEELCKPLVIHQVKSLNEILFYKKRYSPSQRWLVHGFRGNLITARQLLNAGIEFSVGCKFVPEILQIIPMKSLFLESDDSSCFNAHFIKVADLLNITEPELEELLVENSNSFLNL